jgi:hypothetical protein
MEKIHYIWRFPNEDQLPKFEDKLINVVFIIQEFKNDYVKVRLNHS